MAAKRAITDARLHLPGAAGSSPVHGSWNLDESGFIRYLDKCGVDRGVVHAVPPPEPKVFGDVVEANRGVLRFVEKHRRRFTGACALDPRFPEESLRELDDWKGRFGMVWVADLRFAPAEPGFRGEALERLLRHAHSLSMVAAVNADPDGVDRLAQSHPDATIVLSQLEAGADRPQLLRRIELAARGKNFHLEAGPRGYERMGLIEFAVEHVGEARVVYGSSFLPTSPAAVIAKVENAFLTRAQQDAILSGNIDRLLRTAGWRF
jgi:predicted TIM-barrel fold metal-dependent hydrolase